MGRQTTRRKPGDLPFFLINIESSGKKVQRKMTLKNRFLFCFILICQCILAQDNNGINLEEVVISDTQLKNFSNSQLVLSLKDSILKKNQPSLTSFLNYNSFIYFKESGFGMVASPSFRGTTAQQTAVIWNGININSQLNGQTDFNTISTRNYNNISIKSGGGSAVYGSSAVGGTIHLNNVLEYKKQFENDFLINYGSFNTLDLNYKLKLSSGKFSTFFGVSRFSSDNDYKYLNTNLRNQNGQFYNNTIDFNFGFRLNSKHFIQFYNQVFDGSRNFSGTVSTISKSKYTDFNTRNMLEWTNINNHFIAKLKMAFLTEKYNYFENKNTNNYSYGKSKTFISKYDLNLKINSKMNINGILEFNQNIGFGTDIQEVKRNIYSSVLLFKHQLLPAFQYELSFRKEITSNYKSPFLYSFGTKYTVSDNYLLRANASRNFRIPTFNDLYWTGAGNRNLKPENANQYEIGQEFKSNNFKISSTVFIIYLNDMIQWLPTNGGVWKPDNIKNVTSKGLETNLNWKKTNKDYSIEFNANYSYTISEDNILRKQLIYVPFNKFNTSIFCNYKNINVNLQFLYNGKVFTTSDNEYELKAYKIANLGLVYLIRKKNNIKIGLDIRNIFNEKYQSVAARPMPGRNFTLNLTFKF